MRLKNEQLRHCGYGGHCKHCDLESILVLGFTYSWLLVPQILAIRSPREKKNPKAVMSPRVATQVLDRHGANDRNASWPDEPIAMQ